MSKGTRIAALAGALALGLAFLFPLWRIELRAPQYPEGLGMLIRVNTIVGEKPHDLQNINGLNHYIGMAKIEPESIPELRFMPWILAGLIGLGLLTAATGKRKLLVTWAVVFFITAVAGLADFYRWEYDYGHNLDPTAAIKVPGLSYQPPLIGTSQLLNFEARSFPAAGGWALILVFLLVAALTAIELRRSSEPVAARQRVPVPRPGRPRVLAGRS